MTARRFASIATALLAGCGRLDFAALHDSGGGGGSDVGSAAGDGAASCIIPGLTDDFSSATPSALWVTNTDPLVMMSQASGQVVITLVANDASSAYGTYTTVSTYDLREHCVSLTVVGVPNPAGTPIDMDFTVADNAGTTADGFDMHLGVLDIFYFDPSYHELTQSPFDATADRIIRFRESAGTTYWETSPDGATFTVRYSEPDRFAFDSVYLGFAGGTYAAVASPGTAIFDNFDLP